MRTAHKVWIGIAATVFAIVAISDLANRSNRPPTYGAAPSVAAAPSTGASASTAASPAATRPTPTAPTGETVQVTRVVDGDTFEIAGGRRVRVLGIDACEVSTSGGREAKEAAESTFDNPYNRPVTLTREPGVDRDRYGRELRYVQVAGVDYGTMEIVRSDVGVYAGHNDASASYVSQLRAADDGPRNCAGTPTATSSSAPSVSVDDDDHHTNLPDGALTGGFCARHWWC